MHIVLVIALLLLLPVAVDAVEIDLPRIAVDVTVMVNGTVPLASGPFVIDDTFRLHGTGSASLILADPCCGVTRSITTVDFSASQGGITANGHVQERVISGLGSLTEQSFNLVTPRYELRFFAGDGGYVSLDSGQVSFELRDGGTVSVGNETVELRGSTFVSGAGAAVSGPGAAEPATVLLLTFGVIGIVALRHWRGVRSRLIRT